MKGVRDARRQISVAGGRAHPRNIEVRLLRIAPERLQDFRQQLLAARVMDEGGLHDGELRGVLADRHAVLRRLRIEPAEGL